MSNWPVHAKITGPIVMIGFGSIGKGCLPLIERHFDFDKSRFVIIDPSEIDKDLAEQHGARFIKAALTREPLEALLATCDTSLRGRRDRALLLFAWASGGRRRAEVAAATRENVHQVGERLWVYTLSQSKGNQAADDRPENDKPIAGAAADALEAWLAASKIASGPLFRRIRHGDHVGEPLTPAAVRRIVKARCELAGVTGDFSAHSLRSGFVTEAGRQNVPLGDTMAMTGHASVATVMRYYRSGATVTSRAARLIDGD